eukprot:XP_017452210.1 PREDICTED: translocator protein 2 isoform X3 [Rattus norvegicus]
MHIARETPPQCHLPFYQRRAGRPGAWLHLFPVSRWLVPYTHPESSGLGGVCLRPDCCGLESQATRNLGICVYRPDLWEWRDVEHILGHQEQPVESEAFRERDLQYLAPLWRMQLQGPVFVGVPLLGPILIWMFTHQLSSRCEDEKKLPWCPPHKVILLVWATIYSVMGYASYLVWKDLGGGFRWSLALPLGLYSFQLALSWTFLMLFLVVDSPGLVRHAVFHDGRRM